MKVKKKTNFTKEKEQKDKDFKAEIFISFLISMKKLGSTSFIEFTLHVNPIFVLLNSEEVL